MLNDKLARFSWETGYQKSIFSLVKLPHQSYCCVPFFAIASTGTSAKTESNAVAFV